MVADATTDALVASAARNYARYPGVCGVSFGSKFQSGTPVPGLDSVQFFVSEKIDPGTLKRTLPKFVYSRTSAGHVDRSRKIPTDVIELRNLEMACVPGDEVAKVGGSTGSVTLLFENKRPPNDKMLLTCSHVASQLSVSPSPGELRGGNLQCFFRGEVLANTLSNNDEVEFDIALVQITEIDDFVDRASPDTGQTFDQFAQLGDLDRLSVLSCDSKPSQQRSLRVESESSAFEQVKTPSGDDVTIGNLHACKGVAERGDSGGIVFSSNRAVGIVVARADDDWVFIHSLDAAVSHLSALSGIDIDPFGIP